CMQVLEFPLTF
nr:immunoglobulin light chain junction region [Macaca mulatta]MOV82053.1 immunoglobulin light chain junction region [Macaca mulatta]MOV83291.1 immunoglobulin light chain junction region [Macaca mulatta]MOV84444.1 immunoglobulin light chain junction region [Macaca mulatta]MOW43896.1 immunoglobulin light chain junction region [Macaca mulatta]